MNFEQTKNLIGRILISAIFIYAIPVKVISFERNIDVISDTNISPTLAPFLLYLAIIELTLGSTLFI